MLKLIFSITSKRCAQQPAAAQALINAQRMSKINHKWLIVMYYYRFQDFYVA